MLTLILIGRYGLLAYSALSASKLSNRPTLDGLLINFSVGTFEVFDKLRIKSG